MEKTALITGASEGIGKEFARLFAQNHYNLILVARNKNKLEDLASEIKKLFPCQVHVIAQDLTEDNAAKTIYNTITNTGLSIDVLINNAGIGVIGPFVEQSLEQINSLLKTNINALTELTHFIVPEMIAKKQGGIINVASTASFQPGPNMALYYASKAFVLSFTEALHYELKPLGVAVTAVCPGPTKTEFFNRAHMTDRRLVSGLVPMATAKEVAEIGYAALEKNKRVVIVGAMNRFMAGLAKLSPHALSLAITSYFHQKI